ncbi:autotransporter assembly complex protein TamA [Robiginitomaculum antarcticum]|uniref:autotransporter assembly complex protein TamA n=1 Tax=Robiginitomaculum antarcticum TaxID=437507 RepID=UPI00037B553F|nr:autotransporter assembly complex family protein [Robiginitomaculum antarcticum]
MARYHYLASLSVPVICAVIASPCAAQTVSVSYAVPLDEEIKETIAETLPEITEAQSALHARRQARQAQKLVKDALNSYGYYDPVLTTSVDDIDGRPAPLLSVDPGRLFTVDRAQIRYLGESPREDDLKAVEDELPVKTGQPAIPAQIIDAERVIASKLRRLGYAFSEIRDRDVIGDRDVATISVRYNVMGGERIRFGRAVYPDNIRTKSDYLDRLNPTQPGELFDPEQIGLYNSRLSETRLFNSSSARLSEEPVEIAPNGDAVHDIILSLSERPRNTLALGGNYGTDEGFGVTAELTRRNLTRRGDMLVANLKLAQRESGIDLTWRRPNELGYGKGLVFSAAVLDEETDAYDQQLARAGIGYEVIKGPEFSYNFGVTGQVIRETDSLQTQDFQTISTYGSAKIDKSDSLLDPRKGWRAEGRIAPTYAFGGDSGGLPYVRAVGQIRGYLPLDEKTRYVAAGRLRIGTLLGAESTDVPADSRFYAGGGGSVRGYEFQAIGPVNANNDPIGGRSLMDGSAEFRWRYSDKIGVVGFVDAGNISDEQYPAFDNIKVGAGIGARYMTPAGPIRFDFAIPLNPDDDDEPVQVYISIGQAF